MSDDTTTTSTQKLDYALDLMRRLPPKDIEANLISLIDLAPDLGEDLLSAVDQPLKVALDAKTGKEYLKCDYNRDGDSYRSPWSNEYEPPFEDGLLPSDRLRKLEIEANQAFDIYRELYFEGGVSSVYLWDNSSGFAGVVLIKKNGADSSGCWDSIHVIECNERNRAQSTAAGSRCHYKLTSTVMLWLESAKGVVNLGGSLMRQKEADIAMDETHSHVACMGRLIEEMENQIRLTLNTIYFDKTKSILNSLRSTESSEDKAKMDAFRGELMSKMVNRHST